MNKEELYEGLTQEDMDYLEELDSQEWEREQTHVKLAEDPCKYVD